MVINWGASQLLERMRVTDTRIVNTPKQVKIAGNKLFAFQALQGGPNIRIPEFTTDRTVAQEWVPQSGVVVRHVLSGHSGNGIEVVREGELPRAPLYTKLLKKKKEFRVHVMDGEVIDVQEKRKRSDYEGEFDSTVRNYHTGWVYCRGNIEQPDGLAEQAIGAVQALGLDFGAVDILYNQHYNTCTILEVNTAPGLEGTTITNYEQAFRRLLA